MASGGGVLIKTIHLLRNVGQFDSVNAAQFDLLNLVVIYAENGRGKTMLAAILRSARTGDPIQIFERHRLGASHPPHIMLRDQAGVFGFQDAAWPRTLPQIAVFDDQFVSENVCSGMELQPGHRQNLPCGSSPEQRRLGTRGAKTIAVQPSSIE
jgi:wobble nucleotide-excising tRNase